jgi:hypothetical protein
MELLLPYGPAVSSVMVREMMGRETRNPIPPPVPRHWAGSLREDTRVGPVAEFDA